MTETEDHERLADELEGQANELQDKSTGLEQEIGDVKQDWERKRADEGVPGAVPRHADTDRDEPGDEVNPEGADRGRAGEEPEDAAGKTQTTTTPTTTPTRTKTKTKDEDG